mmetsp:Transcript_1312/g.4163  ORF Transcript_1312/g.4163 Transcript_1312/m.4163 type:complete len:210 (-) Transcript_1312:606-1235(-)
MVAAMGARAHGSAVDPRRQLPTYTWSWSARPAASRLPWSVGPPSNMACITRRLPRDSTTARRSRPPPGRTPTASCSTPARSHAAPAASCPAAVVSISVGASFCSMSGPAVTRPAESRTTRRGTRGSAPSQPSVAQGMPSARTVSCGSSLRAVPEPTTTAWESARRRWASARASGPVIQRELPSAQATAPSMLTAVLTTQKGRRCRRWCR